MSEHEVTIEFKGRHDHISERMQEHAAKKLARLGRFDGALLRIEVVADHVHENPEVELIVHQKRGAPLVAKERGPSFSATVDMLVDKMEVQLRRQKEKRTGHKGQGHKGLGLTDSAVGDDRTQGGAPIGAREETYEEVVRKSLSG